MARHPVLSSPSMYDEELGWVGIPDTFEPDMYGPGKYVRTNSRGFRDDRETSVDVPDGKIRVICSGDSFTYGQGVANDRTWCHLLSRQDQRLDTVNLAQPGYGIDQMYLRYLRDGAGVQHSVHIFAFVDGDLNRMSRVEQHGHGKPTLRLVNGELVTENVPVPRLKWSVSRALERADFRIFDLARRVLARVTRANQRRGSTVEAVGNHARQVFSELRAKGKENGALTIFVYLPTENDIAGDTPWHSWIRENVAVLGPGFVDLTDALRTIDATRFASFFITDSNPAAGHYTEQGNEWAANEILDHLLANSHVSTLLGDNEIPNPQERTK